MEVDINDNPPNINPGINPDINTGMEVDINDNPPNINPGINPDINTGMNPDMEVDAPHMTHIHKKFIETGWQRFLQPQSNVLPYSNNLINTETEPVNHQKTVITIRDIIKDVEQIKRQPCEVNVGDATGENVFDEELLSDDVPSSQGTDIGRNTTSFDVISYILSIISPYNRIDGLFDEIKLMIHSLFHHKRIRGVVGITRAGVLSEYTATIYYGVPNHFWYHKYIIKIMLHFMNLVGRFIERKINYDFKLDSGIKPGDTIKLILSLTFGNGVGANVILIPILNIVSLNMTLPPNAQNAPNIDEYMSRFGPGDISNALSIFDLIARIRLYANQEAFGALIEPTDVEKVLMVCFFHDKTRDQLVSFIQYIKFSFYDNVSQYKNFAFFLNVFFNFYKVSMILPEGLNSRSTAKIMYTDFFTKNNNYGSIIRIFIKMMSNELLKAHAVMFLSGSNAARAYKLIQDMLSLPPGVTPEQLYKIRMELYDIHMANLSDNDFMFYLINDLSESHRMTIRMMLGACLYYLKYILTPAEYSLFTELLEGSISIVGHDDHLLAQRLNANRTFLERCFNANFIMPGYTISDFLESCNFPDFNFYESLSGNVTLAFLDVVFKHNTAYSWYISVFSIFGVTINDSHADALQFLTTEAMAVNCIATPWTLILNILYTIFVTENCIARIVVGKLGNDPKNLEKYFSILNTHLGDLHTQYTSRPSTEQIIQEIQTTCELQDAIIFQSQICQQQVTTANPTPLAQRYFKLQTDCQEWVQQMFNLARDPSKRELFFLKADYPFTTRTATPLELGICCTWSVNGNICNKEQFVATFANISPATFQPVYTDVTPSEQRMHEIVPELQRIIYTAISTVSSFNIIPIPQLQDQPREINHYFYMNYLWKHLTETSINLRSLFKSIVKDLTRIVGSKIFTSIALLGAHPCGFVFDELIQSNNTTLTRYQLDAIKNGADIIKCRRGLLPLLLPDDPNSELFATMVVELLFMDYTDSKHSREIYTTNNILLFLGFLFSIKIKSNASVGPRNWLSAVDSVISFSYIPKPKRDSLIDILSTNPAVPECPLQGLEHDGGGKQTSSKKSSSQPPELPQPTKGISAGVSKKEEARAVRAAKAAAEKEEKERAAKEKKERAAAAAAAAKEEKERVAAAKAAAKAAAAAAKAAAAAAKAETEKYLHQLLHPDSGPFKKFMDKIKYVLINSKEIVFDPITNVAGIKRETMYNIDRSYSENHLYGPLFNSVGGGNHKNNKTKSNNKILKTNIHTLKNKYKRNNKHIKYNSGPKYRKINTSLRSVSQSNRHKSKSKFPKKNVTFKRRKRSNRH